jgi:hypothetical protein
MMDLPNDPEAKLAQSFMNRVDRAFTQKHLPRLEGAAHNAVWNTMYDLMRGLFKKDADEIAYEDSITQAAFLIHRAENCPFWKPQHIGRPCRHINARSPKCQKHFTDCPLHAKENDDG